MLLFIALCQFIPNNKLVYSQEGQHWECILHTSVGGYAYNVIQKVPYLAVSVDQIVVIHVIQSHLFTMTTDQNPYSKEKK